MTLHLPNTLPPNQEKTNTQAFQACMEHLKSQQRPYPHHSHKMIFLSGKTMTITIEKKQRNKTLVAKKKKKKNLTNLKQD